MSEFSMEELATEMSVSIPVFSGPIHNVTVNVGREAVLECRVNNLKQYKVFKLVLYLLAFYWVHYTGWTGYRASDIQLDHIQNVVFGLIPNI